MRRYASFPAELLLVALVRKHGGRMEITAKELADLVPNRAAAYWGIMQYVDFGAGSMPKTLGDFLSSDQPIILEVGPVTTSSDPAKN